MKVRVYDDLDRIW